MATYIGYTALIETDKVGRAMRFKNSINLLFPNFGTIFKSLLHRIIVLAIGGVMFAALVLPNIMFLLKSQELEDLFRAVANIFKTLFGGESGGETVVSASKALNALAMANHTKVVLAIVFLLLIYFVMKFLNGLASYTLGHLVHDYMGGLVRSGFTATLLRNLKRACLYEIVHTFVSFVFGVAVGVIAYYVGFALMDVLSVFSLMLAFVIVVVLVAIKHALLSPVMPAMVVGGENLKKAFSIGLKQKKKEFLRAFAMYFIAVYLVIVFNAVAALFTFGTGIIVSVPLTYLFLVCLQMVNYYTITGKKYYLDYDHIVVPLQSRKEEKILEDLDV